MAQPLHDRRDDWLAVLRKAVEREGLRVIANRLRRSKAAISGVVNGTYKASTDRIEERVRGELMNKTHECPVLGEISPARCQDEQAKPFAATNPTRVAVYKACRAGCPHFKGRS
jgi:hypothetical protein